MRLKAKSTRYGLVEVVQKGSDYVLYVDGAIKAISSDLSYVLSQYDRY